jgi:hypothetical protein
MGGEGKQEHSQPLYKIDNTLRRIAVVRWAWHKAHPLIETASGGHGGWNGLEIDRFAPGSGRSVENSLGQGPAHSEAAPSGTHPEALHLPGFVNCGNRKRAPGNKSGWLVVRQG